MIRNRRGALALASTIGLALVLPAAASANHSWGGYHWARTTNAEFTLKVGDNVSGVWDGMFDTAISDWSTSRVLNLSKVAGNGSPRKCRPVLGMVEVCNADYGGVNWLGVAQIWLSNGHIAQGTVKNNDHYFGSSTYAYNNTAEMQHVICQEIGHTFGLDHQSTDGSSLDTCMDYYHNTSGSDTKSTHPNAGDYDELKCIYDTASAGKTLTSGPHSCVGTGHLDGTTTIGASAGTANANAAAASAASGWGRLVASSANGKEQTLVMDLGGGRSIVTFVIWA